MNRTCRRHDYDRKFETVASLLMKIGGAAPPPTTTRLDEVTHLLAAHWRALGVRQWEQRSAQTLATRVAGWLAPWVLKSLLAVRIILGDQAVRRLLVSAVALRRRGAAIELSRLLADLFRLGILRSGGRDSPKLGFHVETSIRYDSQARRLVAETVGPGDAAIEPPPGVGASRAEEFPVRDIVWDHSAIGTTVRVVIAGRPAWVFLGPDGQYRFRALAALAERDADSVWAAFRLSPGGAGTLR
jgi:hypothetical protein